MESREQQVGLCVGGGCITRKYICNQESVKDVGLALTPRLRQKKVGHKAFHENVYIGRLLHQAVFKFSFYIHSTNT